MTDHTPLPGPTIDIARLSARTERAFCFVPDSEERARLMANLDLRGLKKVRLEGMLVPLGRTDWELTATLGATAVQDCVVTLEPVTTRIDAPIARRYLAKPPPEPEGEFEMPEDETEEPLPEVIDLARVLEEALVLALPDYPRAEGVDPLEQAFTEPGRAPMTDEDARPFAALKALRGGSGDEGEG